MEIKNNMKDKNTRQCELLCAMKFNESSKTTYCCRERYGFIIKHWKCVGRGEKGCPLRGIPIGEYPMKELEN